MKYEVRVDFGDNAVHHAPKVCDNRTELALYLERIPSMIGFEINGQATIEVKFVPPGVEHPVLFIQPLKETP